MEIHIQLEEMLAEYKHTEAALVFVAGIAANRGTIQAIMGEEDAIISDELNHGSIIDGVRLTKSKRFVYPHLDMEGLKKVLWRQKKQGDGSSSLMWFSAWMGRSHPLTG